MRVVLDTTIIVEIDRKKDHAIDIVKKLISDEHIIIISTVTVSEILAGACHRSAKAVVSARQILGQFLWSDLDGDVAEKTAEYLSYLTDEGKIIEYPDIVIAATFKIEDADYLLTLNKPHFENLPNLKGKVFTPKEFLSNFSSMFGADKNLKKWKREHDRDRF